MFDIIIMIFTGVGALFALRSAMSLENGVTVLKMPDTFLRISVTTKAATLGSGFSLVAAAMYFNTISVNTRVIVIVLFIILTAPVSGHLISRAAYRSGNKLWKGTKMDDLEGKYDDETGKLS